MNRRTPESGRATKIAVGAAILLVWALAFRPWSDSAVDSTDPAPGLAPPELASHETRGTHMASALESPELSPSRELPHIHDIRVDKSVVCRGEENFVSIGATDPDGSDAHLRISLRNSDGVGPRIPFRLFSNTLQDMPSVLVEGRGGAEVTAPLPPIQVKDCEVDRSAAIDLLASGASTNEWRFRARVTSGTFEAQTYEWKTGDGTRLSSTSPEVTHSYRFRTQDKRYSNFLVTVTMRSAAGEVLDASRALGLSNPAFGRLVRHGEVTLFSQRVGGAGEELTRLYHAYPAPVEIERVQLRVRDERTGSEAIVGTYPAEKLLGLRYLLPGQPKDVQLTLPDEQLPADRPLTLVFEVSGSTSDGLPASGVFSTQML